MQAELSAELILYNGNILTMDDDNPRAEAVAISHGRFLAAGASAAIRNLASVRTKSIDLEGGTVVPGFIDAHCHPSWAGPQHLKQIDCALESITAIQNAIRQRAARTPSGEWILGFKYDDTKTAERRLLTTKDLDEATTRHPVFIQHRGTHTAYVNSLALKLAHVDEGTSDPVGGRLHRDPSTRRLTGRIEEKAQLLFTRFIPDTLTRSERQEAAKLISKMMARAGITSVHDAYGTPEALRSFWDAHEAGELFVRVYCFIGSDDIEPVIGAGIRTGFGNEWVRVGAMKMTCDGSISEYTARLSDPLEGRPTGIIVTETEEMYVRARRAHELGWQIGVHANGDEAIDRTLRVYEKLQQELPRRDPRFRIEHCTVMTEPLLERLKTLRCIPNPFSTYIYYHGEKMHPYGSERLESMFAVRTFLDAGLPVTMTSDYPPGPFEPMMALQSMVTRTDSSGHLWGARQRITIEEALRVGTLHGAYASFEENLKGSIRPGKLADLVVLGRDPTREDPFSLLQIPVERTMVGGRWVHEA